jgi:hypothetical protein
MKRLVSAALAVFAIVAAAAQSPAETRCFRTSHQWFCAHHRVHFAGRAAYRRVAAGYGYSNPYYGSGYGSYGSSYP